jgi:hypothetical protein
MEAKYWWRLAALLAVIAVIGVGMANANDKDNASASGSSGGVTVVASKSTCFYTGVSDVYTGDGKVLFTFTLRNTGDAKDVSVTPVRHYSDGETNESVMDTMTAPMSGYSTEPFRSGQLGYEAHAHEVVSCGLRLEGGTEIPIRATHL